ncbi:hypothetical protein GQ54DRAFT_176025 [Martensiomyces pterosporus]|nr:hypothetical protein GQ54DRAFT_176025 [Martensiomyces pterosporus]
MQTARRKMKRSQRRFGKQARKRTFRTGRIEIMMMNRALELSRKPAAGAFVGASLALSQQRSLGTIKSASAALALSQRQVSIQTKPSSVAGMQQRALYSRKVEAEKKADASANAKAPVLPPKYASFIRRLLSQFLPQYQAQHVGKALYQTCSAYPGFKEFWIDECQLPESFQTWFSTTSLYVWMAMVRIRADPSAKYYNQELVDCFFRDAEKKIRNSGIKSSRIVNDTLKDLVSSFKGTVMSLDEGFAKSDAVLAAAIWRNLVPVDEKVLQIDAITQYVRSQLAKLDQCDAEQLKAGNFSFDPIEPAL